MIETTADPDGWHPGGGWVRQDLCWPLQPGDYNVMTRYVMSIMPMYDSFNGKEWIGVPPSPMCDADDPNDIHYYSTWWNIFGEPEEYGSQNKDALDFFHP